ncbi:MAG TPA: DegT/DnrJ/EryC1/StrS family aminotransferase [Xanthobacteraceae bacterium]
MIPIARPVLDDREAQAAAAVVLSGWLSQGAIVAEFEAEFSRLVGAAHACAVSSCTSALHLALLTVGVGPGDEVITVSHSFIAAANAVRQCGATPVFVDIDPALFNMDPELIEAAVSPRTRAILCVHQMGMPCNLARIVPIARSHGLIVIEDAACAAGSEIELNGEFQPIGAPHSDIACFSFHPRKVITTGEGGMVTTRRADWDHTFRTLRQHGMSIDASERHRSGTVLHETYNVPAFNYRMTDVQAAIGLQQLGRLPGLVQRRRTLAETYRGLLTDIPDVTPPSEPAWARSNWQSYCVRLPSWADQSSVMQAMFDRGVASRRGIMCAHLEAAYRDYPPRRPLPHSEAAHRHCILLPLFPQMTETMQDEVISALGTALAARARAGR